MLTKIANRWGQWGLHIIVYKINSQLLEVCIKKFCRECLSKFSFIRIEKECLLKHELAKIIFISQSLSVKLISISVSLSLVKPFITLASIHPFILAVQKLFHLQMLLEFHILNYLFFVFYLPVTAERVARTLTTYLEKKTRTHLFVLLFVGFFFFLEIRRALIRNLISFYLGWFRAKCVS